MPSLDNYKSSEFIKLLLIGAPMSGKTGALASLVAKGYKLRILDYDAKMGTLQAYVKRNSPDKLKNVEVVTLRDKIKSTAMGSIVDGMPKAFNDGGNLLDKWSYKDDAGVPVDLGVPSTWGKDTIVVIDSLTYMGRAAMDWAEPLVPRGKGGEIDGRAPVGKAQDAIMDRLMLLTSKWFATNVIVTAHISYNTFADGIMKGFPSAPGKALGPNIPSMFSSMAMCQTVAGKRSILTASTALLDLANPAPFAFEGFLTLPIETGLATFFEKVLAAT